MVDVDMDEIDLLLFRQSLLMFFTDFRVDRSLLPLALSSSVTESAENLLKLEGGLDACINASTPVSILFGVCSVILTSSPLPLNQERFDGIAGNLGKSEEGILPKGSGERGIIGESSALPLSLRVREGSKIVSIESDIPLVVLDGPRVSEDDPALVPLTEVK